MWAFVILIVVFVAFYFTGKFFMDLMKKPQKSLSNITEDHAAMLTKAQSALDVSDSHLRELQTDVDHSVANINVLTNRAKNAAQAGKDDDARQALRRLKTEKDALSAKQSALQQAKETHDKYIEIVERERKIVVDAKRNANSLENQLALSETVVAFEQSSSTIDDAQFKLREDVAKSEAKVSALTAGSGKDEFSKAADDADIEAQLAELKK